MRRLGLFLIVYAGLVIAFLAYGLILRFRLVSSADWVAGVDVTRSLLNQEILETLRSVSIHLLIGVTGAGLIVAARAIHSGTRRAYMAGFAFSAMAAFTALLWLWQFFRSIGWLAQMDWMAIFGVVVWLIPGGVALLLAVRVFFALGRLYLAERRVATGAKP